MSPHDDVSRLRDMLDAAHRAVAIAQDRQRTELDSDPLLCPALERLVEIVGEAAVHVSESRKGAMPDVPWAQIIAMRNRLSHAYLTIDADILWTTVRHDLPHIIVVLSADLNC